MNRNRIIELEDQHVYLGGIGELIDQSLVLDQYSHICVIVDAHTKTLCLPVLEPHIVRPFSVIEIPAGEQYKTLKSCAHVWSEFLRIGADRKSLCVNLGGGVVGDLGGFCAATFMRGMPFIQVPTTVLAMADASVGGKLGVDFRYAKNYIGLFQQPERVFIDPVFLQTLPERQIRNGMAEVVKHGLIADATFFERLARYESWDFDRDSWLELLHRSTEIKSTIVRKDVREKGERKKLNFGHTIGHAVESAFLAEGYDLLHGEAIFAGMIMETMISKEKGMLKEEELQVVLQGLLKCAEKVPLADVSRENIRKYLGKDKKKEGRIVKYTLLEGIGKAVIDHPVSDEFVDKVMDDYIQL